MARQLIPHFLIIVFFFLLLFTYTKLAGPISFSVDSITTTKTDTFSVTASGKAITKPDIAVLSVGIQANGQTVKGVQEEINEVINKVSENIKKVGVEEKDIQTTNYSIYPTYDYREGTQEIIGYSASTNLSIKVRDLDKVNEVIDTATDSGANQVFGVSFDVDDKTKAEDEARQKAVVEAKKKAEQAAKIAGFKLGKIINYSENFEGEPRPVPLTLQSVGAPEATSQTRVEPGSSEINIVVTLSYELR